MLNACENQTQFYEMIALLFFGAGSMIQLLLYKERPQTTMPQVREIAYTLDVAMNTYIDNGVQVLAISKWRNGGGEFFTFPLSIRRRQIERIYDVCIKWGKPPSPESNLLLRDVLTRAQLQAFKDDAYEKRWIEYHRNGAHSPWSFTKQGEMDLEFCYLRLNGKLPYDAPQKHAKALPHHASLQSTR